MLQFLPLIGGIAQKWMDGKQVQRTQSHTQQMAIHEQHASEFRDLQNRTWWDSLIDGINRLPRPVMTFGVIWLFWYCVDDPDGFQQSAEALKAVPYEMWVALWMVLGFWFGTKAIEKMPRGFGRLGGTRTPKINKNAPDRQKTRRNSSLTARETSHEDDDWESKKNLRYKRDDWDHLN